MQQYIKFFYFIFIFNSVIAIAHTTFNVTETITFKLMKRIRGSLIAYPIDIDIKNDLLFFNMSENEDMNVYSKLLLANKNDINFIIERERKELQKQLDDEKDCPERCFIDQALELLKFREETIEQSLKELSLNDFEENLMENQQNAKIHYFYQGIFIY